MSAAREGADGRAAIARCREAIEGIDRDLVALLAKRVAQSREIGRLKRDAGLPTLDPKREAEVIRRATAAARDQGVPEEPVRDIFWHIIGLARTAQLD